MSTTQVSTVEQQTLETIASGHSTIKSVMVSYKTKKVGFRIDGVRNDLSIWIDFKFFSPGLKAACRTEDGEQFDLLDEHLYHLTGQPVEWDVERSALLKKGDKFESGSKVTAETFMILKQFHLSVSPIELRQVIKQTAKGVLIADFTSEHSDLEKQINSFLNPAPVKPAAKRKPATTRKKATTK